jgi:hypothetical protein
MDKLDPFDYFDLRAEISTRIFTRWKEEYVSKVKKWKKNDKNWSNTKKKWESRIQEIEHAVYGTTVVKGKRPHPDLEEFKDYEYTEIVAPYIKSIAKEIVGKILRDNNSKSPYEYFSKFQIPYCKIENEPFKRNAILNKDSFMENYRKQCIDSLFKYDESKILKEHKYKISPKPKRTKKVNKKRRVFYNRNTVDIYNKLTACISSEVFDISARSMLEFALKKENRENYNNRINKKEIITITPPQMYLVYAFYTGIRQATPLKKETLQRIIDCLDEQRMSHFATFHLIRAATKDKTRLTKNFFKNQDIIKKLELVKKHYDKDNEYWTEIPDNEVQTT